MKGVFFGIDLVSYTVQDILGSAVTASFEVSVVNEDDLGVLSLRGRFDEQGYVIIEGRLEDIDGLDGQKVKFSLFDSSKGELKLTKVGIGSGDSISKTFIYHLADGDSVEDLSIVVSYSDATGVSYGEGGDFSAISASINNIPQFVLNAGIGNFVEENTYIVGTVVADDDGIVSYSLGGIDASLFSLDINTGELRFIYKPDYEQAGDNGGNNVYDLVVTADDGIFEVSEAVSLTVTDVFNSLSFVEIIGLVEEGGTIIARLDAENGVSGQVRFELLDEGGELIGSPVFGRALNNNARAEFTLANDQILVGKMIMVKAIYTDGLGVVYDGQGDNPEAILSEKKLVANVNDTPVVISRKFSIDENLVSELGVISGYDRDEDSITFSVSDERNFSIDSRTGRLSLIAPQDYEISSDHSLSVIVVVDDGQGEENSINTAEIRVIINDVNDSPIFSRKEFLVEEGFTGLLGFVGAFDEDADANLVYSIEGGNPAFNINRNLGRLSLSVAQDYERVSSLDVLVSVSDGYEIVSQIITVSLIDVNDSMPIIRSVLLDGVSISEGSGGVVGTVDAFDADTVGILSYSVVSDLFLIEADTGILSAIAERIDFESADVVDGTATVLVSVSDGVGVVSQTFSIFIDDVESGLEELEIVGVVEEGGEITVSLNDEDGVDGQGVDFELLDSGGQVVDVVQGVGTGNQAQGIFVLASDQSLVGELVKVRALYTDEKGTIYGIHPTNFMPIEVIVGMVANVEDGGEVAISGNVEEGGEIRATLTDLDGVDGQRVRFELLGDVGETLIDTQEVMGLGNQAQGVFVLASDQSLVNQLIRVRVFYTDNQGTSYDGQLGDFNPIERVVKRVSNVDDEGELMITGSVKEGEEITVTLIDLDGVDGQGVVFELLDGTGQVIEVKGETIGVDYQAQEVFVLASDQSLVGEAIKVRASYTDELGMSYNNQDGIKRSVLSASQEVSNVDDSQSLLIVGAIEEGGEITIILTDEDGINEQVVVFELLDSSGQVLEESRVMGSGMQAETSFVLASDQSLVGEAIRVVVSYTDEWGVNYDGNRLSYLPVNVERIVSNVDDEGEVEIIGAVEEGGMITAVLIDLDGVDGQMVNFELLNVVGEVLMSNQGVMGEGDQAETVFTLVSEQSLVGQFIKVRAIYTDEWGTGYSAQGGDFMPVESVTRMVRNVDDEGEVEITGAVEEGGIITATLTDLDGVAGQRVCFELLDDMGEVLMSTKEIVGEGDQAQGFFVLASDQSLVGEVVKVRAIYTDEWGMSYNNQTGDFVSAESKLGTVLNVDDVGEVEIIGAVEEGGMITAVLSDLDGLAGQIVDFKLLDDVGEILMSSQEVVDEGNQVETSFVLASDQSLVGESIRVMVFYTDEWGGVYDGQVGNFMPVDSGLMTVLNVDDVGEVEIVGVVEEGGIITATLSDLDGISGQRVIFELLDDMGEVLEASQEFVGVNNHAQITFNLAVDQSLVGGDIRVRAMYTDEWGGVYDGQVGNFMPVESELRTVLNVDDVGEVEIIGAVEEGGMITATLIDLDGVDGQEVVFELLDDVGEVLEASQAVLGVDEQAGAIFNLADDQSLVGRDIRVRAIYTDEWGGVYDGQVGNFMPVESELRTVLNVDDVGEVEIIGAVEEGGMITATLIDLDGVDGQGVVFELLDDVGEVLEASQAVLGVDNQAGAIFNLADDQSLVGGDIRVRVSYTDEWGGVYDGQVGNFMPVDSGLRAVLNVDDVGEVEIIGAVEEGGMITATLIDLDGVDGQGVVFELLDDVGQVLEVSQAVLGVDEQAEASFVLSSDQSLVGEDIRVRASYTDEEGINYSPQGVKNSIVSQARTVANVDDIWSLLLVSDSIEEGGTVTANLRDLDGVNGQVIIFELLDSLGQSLEESRVIGSGIRAQAIFTLSDDQSLVGQAIRVKSSYTDEWGTVYDGQINSMPQSGLKIVSNVDDEGEVEITGGVEEGGTITATLTDLDGLAGQAINFELLDGGANQVIATTQKIINIGSVVEATFVLSEDQSLVGKNIKVRASYTDEWGTSSIPESEVRTVLNVDDEGALEIIGVAEEGGAIIATLIDLDGVDGQGVTFEILDDAGQGLGISQEIVGVDTNAQAIFVLSEDQSLVGKNIKVRVSYTDEWGTSSMVESEVRTVLNVDDEGEVEITGALEEGGTITATLIDLDGVNGKRVRFQLLDDAGQELGISQKFVVGVDTNAQATFVLSEDQSLVGKNIKVRASYTDEWGTSSIPESEVRTVANVDDEGALEIIGVAEEGGAIIATLIDLDGVDGQGVTFEILDDAGQGLGISQEVVGLDANSQAIFVLSEDQSLVGKNIKVRVSYTDEWGTSSMVESEVRTVLNVDDEGEVEITGAVEEGGTITATLIDLDGVNGKRVRFELLDDVGQELGISQEVVGLGDRAETTLSLGADQSLVGKNIRVSASYTDEWGTVYDGRINSKAESDLALVSNVDDEGEVEITGAVEEGGTITATLTDLDGLRNQEVLFELLDDVGQELGLAQKVVGMNNQARAIFVLADDQSLVGENISVRATYSDEWRLNYDGEIGDKSIVLESVGIVANVNDAPEINPILINQVPVDENQEAVVGKLSVQDPDNELSELTYTVSDSSKFTINQEGTLSTIENQIDNESDVVDGTVTATVTVSDNAGGESIQDFSITVNNIVGERLVAIPLRNTSLTGTSEDDTFVFNQLDEGILGVGGNIAEVSYFVYEFSSAENDKIDLSSLVDDITESNFSFVDDGEDISDFNNIEENFYVNRGYLESHDTDFTKVFVNYDDDDAIEFKIFVFGSLLSFDDFII